MNNPRPQKLPTVITALNGAPNPKPIDVEIDRNHGSTVALETTRARLQESKRLPIPTPSQRIEQLTRENGHLRHEVAFHQQLQDAMRYLQIDILCVMQKLQQAIDGFTKVQREAEAEYMEFWDAGTERSYTPWPRAT